MTEFATKVLLQQELQFEFKTDIDYISTQECISFMANERMAQQELATRKYRELELEREQTMFMESLVQNILQEVDAGGKGLAKRIKQHVANSSVEL
jgi:hypothetical protein